MNKVMLFISTMLMSFNTNGSDHLYFDGYIGYRYIWSSIDAAPLTSAPEIGALVNYKFDNNFSIFLQGAYNEHVPKSLEHAIVYAFLNYTNSIYDVPFQVNIGKLKHDVNLHYTHLTNPHTRPGVVSPQSVNWNVLKQTLTSGYGINFKLFWENLEIGYSISQHVIVDEEVDSISWTGFPNVPMSPEFGSHRILVLKYDATTGDYGLNFSHTSLDLNDDIEGIEFIGIGGYHYIDDFYVEIEALLVKSLVDKSWFDVNDLRYGISFWVSYDIFEDVQLYVGYDQYFNSGLPNDVGEWKNYTIGFSTMITDNVEIKSEVHKVYGGRALHPSDWERDLSDWWYIGTSVVYHF